MVKLLIDKAYERMKNIVNIENLKIEHVVEKINSLYKISQERELTKEEKELQGKLRKRYIDNVKKNFRAQLEGIEPKNRNKG
jgi:hypothetical protein